MQLKTRDHACWYIVPRSGVESDNDAKGRLSREGGAGSMQHICFNLKRIVVGGGERGANSMTEAAC